MYFPENKENDAKSPERNTHNSKAPGGQPQQQKVRRSVLKEFDPYAPDSPMPIKQAITIEEEEIFEDAETSLPSFRCSGRESIIIPELKDCRPHLLNLNESITPDQSFAECLENVSHLDPNLNSTCSDDIEFNYNPKKTELVDPIVTIPIDENAEMNSSQYIREQLEDAIEDIEVDEFDYRDKAEIVFIDTHADRTLDGSNCSVDQFSCSEDPLAGDVTQYVENATLVRSSSNGGIEVAVVSSEVADGEEISASDVSFTTPPTVETDCKKAAPNPMDNVDVQEVLQDSDMDLDEVAVGNVTFNNLEKIGGDDMTPSSNVSFIVINDKEAEIEELAVEGRGNTAAEDDSNASFTIVKTQEPESENDKLVQKPAMKSIEDIVEMLSSKGGITEEDQKCDNLKVELNSEQTEDIAPPKNQNSFIAALGKRSASDKDDNIVVSELKLEGETQGEVDQEPSNNASFTVMVANGRSENSVDPGSTNVKVCKKIIEPDPENVDEINDKTSNNAYFTIVAVKEEISQNNEKSKDYQQNAKYEAALQSVQEEKMRAVDTMPSNTSFTILDAKEVESHAAETSVGVILEGPGSALRSESFSSVITSTMRSTDGRTEQNRTKALVETASSKNVEECDSVLNKVQWNGEETDMILSNNASFTIMTAKETIEHLVKPEIDNVKVCEKSFEPNHENVDEVNEELSNNASFAIVAVKKEMSQDNEKSEDYQQSANCGAALQNVASINEKKMEDVDTKPSNDSSTILDAKKVKSYTDGGTSEDLIETKVSKNVAICDSVLNKVEWNDEEKDRAADMILSINASFSIMTAKETIENLVKPEIDNVKVCEKSFEPNHENVDEVNEELSNNTSFTIVADKEEMFQNNEKSEDYQQSANSEAALQTVASINEKKMEEVDTKPSNDSSTILDAKKVESHTHDGTSEDLVETTASKNVEVCDSVLSKVEWHDEEKDRAADMILSNNASFTVMAANETIENSVELGNNNVKVCEKNVECNHENVDEVNEELSNNASFTIVAVKEDMSQDNEKSEDYQQSANSEAALQTVASINEKKMEEVDTKPSNDSSTILDAKKVDSHADGGTSEDLVETKVSKNVAICDSVLNKVEWNDEEKDMAADMILSNNASFSVMAANETIEDSVELGNNNVKVCEKNVESNHENVDEGNGEVSNNASFIIVAVKEEMSQDNEKSEDYQQSANCEAALQNVVSINEKKIDEVDKNPSIHSSTILDAKNVESYTDEGTSEDLVETTASKNVEVCDSVLSKVERNGEEKDRTVDMILSKNASFIVMVANETIENSVELGNDNVKDCEKSVEPNHENVDEVNEELSKNASFTIVAVKEESDDYQQSANCETTLETVASNNKEKMEEVDTKPSNVSFTIPDAKEVESHLAEASVEDNLEVSRSALKSETLSSDSSSTISAYENGTSEDLVRTTDAEACDLVSNIVECNGEEKGMAVDMMISNNASFIIEASNEANSQNTEDPVESTVLERNIKGNTKLSTMASYEVESRDTGDSVETTFLKCDQVGEAKIMKSNGDERRDRDNMGLSNNAFFTITASSEENSLDIKDSVETALFKSDKSESSLKKNNVETQSVEFDRTEHMKAETKISNDASLTIIASNKANFQDTDENSVETTLSHLGLAESVQEGISVDANRVAKIVDTMASSDAPQDTGNSDGLTDVKCEKHEYHMEVCASSVENKESDCQEKEAVLECEVKMEEVDATPSIIAEYQEIPSSRSIMQAPETLAPEGQKNKTSHDVTPSSNSFTAIPDKEGKQTKNDATLTNTITEAKEEVQTNEATKSNVNEKSASFSDDTQAVETLARSLNQTIDVEESAISDDIDSTDTSDDNLNATVKVEEAEAKNEEADKEIAEAGKQKEVEEVIKTNSQKRVECRPNIRTMRHMTQVISNPLIVKAAVDNQLERLQKELEELKMENSKKDHCIVAHVLDRDVRMATLAKYKEVFDFYEKQVKKQENDLVKIRLQNENLLKEFTCSEMVFSDLYKKYEKGKNAVEMFNKNVAIIQDNIKNAQECRDKMEIMYQTLQKNIREAHERVEIERQKCQQDIAKLQPIVKRLEIKMSSLETALKQKTDECQALAALCDDITSSHFK